MKIENALFALVMVGAVFILLSANLGSLKAMTVLGGSMSPALNMGDMIFVSSVSPDTIQKNDIITYTKEDAIVTHRVVEIVKSGFIVQGDGNEDPDAETVKPTQLVGKVQFSIPFAGLVMNFVRSKMGLLVFIIFPGIVMMGAEVRKLVRYKRGGREEKISKTNIFMIVVIAGLLMLNIFGTRAYFSDIESSSGNYIGLEQGACVFVNVSKWWTDSNFLPFWDMNYNGSFDIVTHFNDKKGGSYKISGTNPGSFFVHINITGLPAIAAGEEFRIEDELMTSLDEFDDFGYQSQNPVRIYMMGEDCGWGACDWTEITHKFEYSLEERDPWVFRLKAGESIPKTYALYVTIHLQYILQQFTEDQLALFPFDYDNVARVYVKNKWFNSYYATITGNIKDVSGFVAGASPGTAPYFPTPEDVTTEGTELLGMTLDGGELNETLDNETLENVTMETNTTETELNETIELPENETIEGYVNETETFENTTIETNETETFENTTIETNTTEIDENTTIETNTTETGGNETELNETAAIHLEAGLNTFLVPDDWATTAMQLTTDYPLILDVSYTDAESNTVTFISGDPAESSFDITAGMTITINALEAFDIA